MKIGILSALYRKGNCNANNALQSERLGVGGHIVRHQHVGGFIDFVRQKFGRAFDRKKNQRIDRQFDPLLQRRAPVRTRRGIEQRRRRIVKHPSLLNTSGKTLDSLKDFLAQAKALGNSALDNENYLSPIVGKGLKVKDSTPLSKLPHMQTGDKIILRTGKADEMESSVNMTRDTTLNDLGLNIGEKFNIKVGENDWISLEITDLDVKVADFLGQITEKLGADKFSAEIADGKLTIKTLDRSPIILQDDADATAAKAMGFDLSTTHIIESQADWTVKNLADEIGKIDNMTAFVNDKGYLEITSIYGDSLSIADLKGRMGDSFGITGVSDDSENKHKTYAERYNELLKQIDNLVNDASFNGLNLLQGDKVRAIFSEDGTDFRTIKGVKTDSESWD